MAVSDWSATAALNTTVDAVSIAENCPPGNLNDATRAVMANVRAWYGSFSAFVLTIVGSADAAAFRSAIGAAASADLASAIPSGAIMYFARDTPPAGFLAANGANVSRTTYAGLFTAINTLWGAGDGSTTFTLPDLRGEFARGWDNGRGVDSGRAFGTSQAQQTAQHKHVSSYGEHAVTGQFGTITGSFQGSNGSIDNDNNQFLTNDGSDFSGQTVNASGVIGAETRPRNVALLACIKI